MPGASQSDNKYTCGVFPRKVLYFTTLPTEGECLISGTKKPLYREQVSAYYCVVKRLGGSIGEIERKSITLNVYFSFSNYCPCFYLLWSLMLEGF